MFNSAASYEVQKAGEDKLLHHQKWYAAKKQLEVFMNSVEGQKKVDTTTEEESITYWSNMLAQQEERHFDKETHYNDMLEAARAKFEKVERFVKNGLAQIRSSHDKDTRHTRTRLEAAKARLEHKVNSAKPKELLRIEQTIETEWAAFLRAEERLQKANQEVSSSARKTG